MREKKGSDLFILVVVAVVWFAIGWIVNGRLQPTDVAVFSQVQDILLNQHMDAVPPQSELTEAAVKGMLSVVDDPHAAYIPPEIFENFQADFSGDSGVVGMLAEYESGAWVVTAVLPDMPAARAGVEEGDIVVSVDGIPFDGQLSAAEVAYIFRGPVAKEVTLIVRRGETEMTLQLAREPREVVQEAAIIEGDIAYLMQHTFTTNSPAEMEAALTNLLTQNPVALIWDLRSNGGGSMDAAQDILSQFIADGTLFYAELRDGKQRPYPVKGDGIARTIPLVVLVGERTYSAAETAAIAIADHGRGVLIGGVTYGKGTIQETRPLPGGGALQYTVAHWLSPEGEWYETRGVSPDLMVADDPDTAVDEVLETAVAYIRTELVP